MAEKVRLIMDGQELQGLVSFGEIVLDVAQIEVPEFDIIRLIDSGVRKIPVIDVIFKLPRGSKTQKIIKDWFFNRETHDLIKVRTDAHGIEALPRTLLPSCRCVKYQEPEYKAESPTYAQIQTRFIPWDVIAT